MFWHRPRSIDKNSIKLFHSLEIPKRKALCTALDDITDCLLKQRPRSDVDFGDDPLWCTCSAITLQLAVLVPDCFVKDPVRLGRG